jgi:hypothetical protein
MPPEIPANAATQGPTPFHYHGHAHAFSGKFTRPFHEEIHVQASSTLPTTGGHGSARVDNFKFHEFISFKAGYTHVSGGYQESDGTNNTLVTSVLEGLNMLDILTADRIVCRLYSKHHPNDAEGRVTMHGSKFENLAIFGRPVNISLDFDLFEDIQTYDEATQAYNLNANFRNLVSDPLRTGRTLRQPGPNGVFFCSLVQGGQINWNPWNSWNQGRSVKVDGHSIHVPGFGKAYFAETFISHGTRTLTMLRFELGSTTGGSGSGGGGSTNGKHYPP